MSDNNNAAFGREYDISASVSDAAGNPADVKSISFIMDKTKPIIDSIELEWGNYLNIAEADASQNVTITMANADASGQTLTLDLSGTDYSGIVEVSRVTIEIPLQDIKDISDNLTVGGLEYDISATVTDGAGNEAVKSVSFWVDKITPNILSLIHI